MDFTVKLPQKTVEKIFSYLELKDLLACTEVSVGWYHLANGVDLWRQFVSEFENGCELGECDAITSNFLDESHPHGLKSIFQFTPLSPINPCKTFIRQRNFLKYNWTHGIHAEHCIQPKDFELTKFSQVKVVFPSKTAQDCLYYPIVGTRGDGKEGLYLIRLDNEPKIVCRIIRTMKKTITFHIACVMRDCVAWVVGDKVQCFDLTSNLSDSTVETLGRVEGKDLHLTMDDNYIVVWNHQGLNIWCKRTHELKLSKSYLSKVVCLYRVCLSYGTLITAIKYQGRGFKIETYDTRNNFQNILQHRFTVSECLLGLNCSKNSIIIQWYVDSTTSYDPTSDLIYEIIRVYDKKTLSEKFSLNIGPSEGFEVVKDFVLVYNKVWDECFCSPDFESMRKLIITTGFNCQQSLSAKAFDDNFVFLFDNILVLENYNDKTLEVWDWGKNVKLFCLNAGNRIKYVLSPQDYNVDEDEPMSYRDLTLLQIRRIKNALDCAKKLLLHVSEARLLALDWDGKLKVYGFG